MKILIAPWGNPERWGETSYRFESRSMKANTSLKIIQDSVNPDKTIIIALDTISVYTTNFFS